MVDNLAIFAASVSGKLDRVRAAASDIPEDRRGSSLRTLVLFLLDRVQPAIADLEREISEAEGDATLESLAVRGYQRLSIQLDELHEVLASSSSAVGRADIPVGLQHLIDVLLEQVLVVGGDPIVLLAAENEYSTSDIAEGIGHLFNKAEFESEPYLGRHPIVFNLPALDPENGLLAPNLAHEVAHAAVARSVSESFSSSIEQDLVVQLLSDQLALEGEQFGSTESDEWITSFDSWCDELLCDAIALAVTGPSFLFAFSAFAPPTSLTLTSTHPSERDRIALHLTMARELGWEEMLVTHSPNLHSWFTEAGDNPALSGKPRETFLRSASELVRPQIIATALAHVEDRLSPEKLPLILEAAEWLAKGIPMVELDAIVLRPWEVVLAGWIASIRNHGDDPASLPKAIFDSAFNALVIKDLEMSSIVSAWREHERPSP